MRLCRFLFRSPFALRPILRLTLPRLPVRMFQEKKLAEDTTAAKTTDEHRDLDTRRKKALWRCRQRGWVEIDLLMGNWAAENIPAMSDKQLGELEVIIAQVQTFEMTRNLNTFEKLSC
ncbi:hypothetical protein AAMO2058_000586600 [Amorphochlora amoebiformis]